MAFTELYADMLLLVFLDIKCRSAAFTGRARFTQADDRLILEDEGARVTLAGPAAPVGDCVTGGWRVATLACVLLVTAFFQSPPMSPVAPAELPASVVGVVTLPVLCNHALCLQGLPCSPTQT